MCSRGDLDVGTHAIWPERLLDPLQGSCPHSRLASHLDGVGRRSEALAEAIWGLSFFPILFPKSCTLEEQPELQGCSPPPSPASHQAQGRPPAFPLLWQFRHSLMCRCLLDKAHGGPLGSQTLNPPQPVA